MKYREMTHSITWKLLLLLVAAGWLAACEPSDTDKDDQSCIAGTTFPADDGCNTCTCPNSGKKSEAGCTLMDCNNGECAPGEQITAPDGCNTCECPDSGKISERVNCTEMECPPDECANKACGDTCTLVVACDAV
jgi:hypothetical protein